MIDEVMEINSQKWWDNEFEVNWTVGIDGRIQTKYFANMFLNTIPFEMKGNVLDWGCALGQGLEAIQHKFPKCKMFGYDFSKIAIKKAIKLYPDFDFSSKEPTSKFNNVYCSNVMEHYSDPIPLLRKLLAASSDYVIIMTPFNQKISDIHCGRMKTDTLPTLIDGFKMMYIVLTPIIDTDLCNIKQIIYIYKKI